MAVWLTDEGHALVERSVDSVLGREASLVAGLTAAERATLAKLLEKLTIDVHNRISATRSAPTSGS